MISEQLNNTEYNKNVIFTADALYSRQSVIDCLESLNLNYILKIKNIKGKESFNKSMLLQEVNSSMKEQTFLTATYNYKHKSMIITDCVYLIKNTTSIFSQGKQTISYILYIERKSINNNKYSKNYGNETNEKIYIITNLKEKFSKDLLHFIYQTKINHWSIESWHKIKDLIYKQDSYFKTEKTAKSYSSILNIIGYFNSKFKLLINKFFHTKQLISTLFQKIL